MIRNIGVASHVALFADAFGRLDALIAAAYGEGYAKTWFNYLADPTAFGRWQIDFQAAIIDSSDQVCMGGWKYRGCHHCQVGRDRFFVGITAVSLPRLCCRNASCWLASKCFREN